MQLCTDDITNSMPRTNHDQEFCYRYDYHLLLLNILFYCCTVHFTRYGFVKEVMDKYKVQ